MKKLIKVVFRYVILPVIALLIVVIAGLLIYYHSQYELAPVEIKDNPELTPAMISSKSVDAILLPVPKQAKWMSGYFSLATEANINCAAQDAAELLRIWKNRMNTNVVYSTRGNIQFKRNSDLKLQAYQLTVLPGKITVEYNSSVGAFYALTTLKQLSIGSTKGIPCVDIHDEPDLQTRGALLDISRGKIPKLETLYGVVDFLADLKYNHLQLYVEGFSFGYPSFSPYWEKTGTPLMPVEIQALDKYCRERFIELVPNQNSLGHMQDWLKQEDLKDLAECPEGYKLLGLIEVKSTLSPTNPRSLELVKKMSEDLLPHFTSQRFNVNLDEPFELGKCKQRPVADPREVARIYMDYAKNLNKYVTSKNKKMMMWGDVVSRTPEVIKEIPRDVTLLEWRYEAIQPYESICKLFQGSGVNYMVCPGTSTWSSYTGRTDNMLANVANAVESAVKYSAEGMLITDWGDAPHLQYLTVSYPGLAWGAALSWNVRSKNDVPLQGYLSNVMGDSAHMIGNLVMDLGRYNQFEEYPMMAMTTSNLAMRLGMMDPVMFNAIQQKMQNGIFELAAFDTITVSRLHAMFNNPKPYRAESALRYMSKLDAQLDSVRLNGPQGALIKSEYKNSIRMVKLAILLKQYILYHHEQTVAQNREMLTTMQSLCTTIIPEHKRLWMQRNKAGGYEESIEGFVKLQSDINRQLDLLGSNAISRFANRTLEKAIAAGVALYMK